MELRNLPSMELKSERARLSQWSPFAAPIVTTQEPSPLSLHRPAHSTGSGSLSHVSATTTAAASPGSATPASRGLHTSTPASSTHGTITFDSLPRASSTRQKALGALDALKIESPYSTGTLSSPALAAAAAAAHSSSASSSTHHAHSSGCSDPVTTVHASLPGSSAHLSIHTGESHSTPSSRTTSSMPISTITAPRMHPGTPPQPHLFSKEDITIVDPTFMTSSSSSIATSPVGGMTNNNSANGTCIGGSIGGSGPSGSIGSIGSSSGSGNGASGSGGCCNGNGNGGNNSVGRDHLLLHHHHHHHHHHLPHHHMQNSHPSRYTSSNTPLAFQQGRENSNSTNNNSSSSNSSSSNNNMNTTNNSNNGNNIIIGGSNNVSGAVTQSVIREHGTSSVAHGGTSRINALLHPIVSSNSSSCSSSITSNTAPPLPPLTSSTSGGAPISLSRKGSSANLGLVPSVNSRDICETLAGQRHRKQKRGGKQPGHSSKDTSEERRSGQFPLGGGASDHYAPATAQLFPNTANTISSGSSASATMRKKDAHLTSASRSAISLPNFAPWQRRESDPGVTTKGYDKYESYPVSVSEEDSSARRRLERACAARWCTLKEDGERTLRYLGYLPMPGDRTGGWYISFLWATFWGILSFATRRVAYMWIVGNMDCPFWMPAGVVLGAFLTSSPRVRLMLPFSLTLSAGMCGYSVRPNMNDAGVFALHALTDYLIVSIILAYVLRRFFGARIYLTRSSYLITFAVTALVAMAIATMVNATYRLRPLYQKIDGSYFFEHFRRWIGRNAVGLFLTLPFVIACHTTSLREIQRCFYGRVWYQPFIVLFLTAWLTGVPTFFILFSKGLHFAFAGSFYLCYPVNIAIANKTGLFGGTLSTLLTGIVFCAAITSRWRHETFYDDDVYQDQLLWVQVFMFVLIMTCLYCVTIVHERDFVKESTEALIQARTFQLELAMESLELASKKVIAQNQDKASFIQFLAHELRNPLHALINMVDFILETNELGGPPSSSSQSGGRAGVLQTSYGGDSGLPCAPSSTAAGGGGGGHLDFSGGGDVSRRTPNATNAAAIESLKAIHISSQYMLHLVNDTLDLGRFDAGKVILEKLPCDIRQLLYTHFTCMKQLAKGTDIDVMLSMPALPRSLDIDGVRFMQILNNLVGNAFKFTEKGSIRMSVKVLESWQQSEQTSPDVSQLRRRCLAKSAMQKKSGQFILDFHSPATTTTGALDVPLGLGMPEHVIPSLHPSGGGGIAMDVSTGLPPTAKKDVSPYLPYIIRSAEEENTEKAGLLPDEVRLTTSTPPLSTTASPATIGVASVPSTLLPTPSSLPPAPLPASGSTSAPAPFGTVLSAADSNSGGRPIERGGWPGGAFDNAKSSLSSSLASSLKEATTAGVQRLQQQQQQQQQQHQQDQALAAGGSGGQTVADANHWIALQVDVRDTGIGMDSDVIPRLFRPYAQATVSTSREYGGSGLGLAIVQKIVHLMEGDINVTSQKETGSCFSFTLPLRVLDREVHPAEELVSRANPSVTAYHMPSLPTDPTTAASVTAPPLPASSTTLDDDFSRLRQQQQQQQLQEQQPVGLGVGVGVGGIGSGPGDRLSGSSSSNFGNESGSASSSPMFNGATAAASIAQVSPTASTTSPSVGPPHLSPHATGLPGMANADSVNQGVNQGVTMKRGNRRSLVLTNTEFTDISKLHATVPGGARVSRHPKLTTSPQQQPSSQQQQQTSIPSEQQISSKKSPSDNSILPIVEHGRAQSGSASVVHQPQVPARLNAHSRGHGASHFHLEGGMNTSSSNPSSPAQSARGGISAASSPLLLDSLPPPFQSSPSRLEIGSPVLHSLVVPSDDGSSFASNTHAPLDVLGTPELEPTQILILIVDDSNINRQVLKRMLITTLSMLSFQIDEAVNGLEAVEMTAQHKKHSRQYAMIFMDVMMPVLDGYQAAKQIREMGVSAPILFTTANQVSPAEIEQLRIDYQAQVLSKPFSRASIAKILREQQILPT